MNRLKNEQKLMNKFQKVFGDKNDVVVCFGDFEQRKHMKYKEPIKECEHYLENQDMKLI